MTIIRLTTDEIRVCSQIAVERWLTKQNSQDKPNYQTGKQNGALEHELLATIRANITEYAAAKLYEIPWTFPWYPNDQHPKRKNHPDAGTRAEIRTIRTRNAIPVWQKDIDKQAVIIGGKVLDNNYYTQVKIFGHLNAHQAQRQEWFDPTANCWRIPVNELNPPPTC